MIPCPACSIENPDSSKFCSECGSALQPEYEATYALTTEKAPVDSHTSSDSSYTRLGLLAAIAFFFASYMLEDFPVTSDWDAWYWGSSLYALTVVAAMGIVGFYTSTTGRPLRDSLARP